MVCPFHGLTFRVFWTLSASGPSLSQDWETSCYDFNNYTFHPSSLNASLLLRHGTQSWSFNDVLCISNILSLCSHYSYLCHQLSVLIWVPCPQVLTRCLPLLFTAEDSQWVLKLKLFISKLDFLSVSAFRLSFPFISYINFLISFMLLHVFRSLCFPFWFCWPFSSSLFLEFFIGVFFFFSSSLLLESAD